MPNSRFVFWSRGLRPVSAHGGKACIVRTLISLEFCGNHSRVAGRVSCAEAKISKNKKP
jgi:hypothetical protein